MKLTRPTYSRPTQLLGALRAQARSTRPLLHSLIHTRSLSASQSTITLLSAQHALRRPPTILHTRSLSLASIFTRKPTPTPPPVVVANVAAFEADANANPHDVQKQVALFEALIGTKVKPGYDVVIARWERMCEFVCTHLSSARLFTDFDDRILRIPSYARILPFNSI